jgi:hypothetical protein
LKNPDFSLLVLKPAAAFDLWHPEPLGMENGVVTENK